MSTLVQPEFVILNNCSRYDFCQGLLFVYIHFLIFKIINELQTLILQLSYPLLLFKFYFFELLIINNEWFASQTVLVVAVYVNLKKLIHLDTLANIDFLVFK